MILSLLQFENVHLSLFKKLLVLPILLLTVMFIAVNNTSAQTTRFTTTTSNTTLPKINALGGTAVAIIYDDGKLNVLAFNKWTGLTVRADKRAFS